jgi:hypothetical protein
MSKADNSRPAGPKAKRAAPGHSRDFNPKAVTPAAVALRAMWPGKSSVEIAAALDNRITPSNVRQWRNNLRPIPPWVRVIMRAWAAEVAETLEATPTGPGSQAGWRNVSGYNANR